MDFVSILFDYKHAERTLSFLNLIPRGYKEIKAADSTRRFAFEIFFKFIACIVMAQYHESLENAPSLVKLSIELVFAAIFGSILATIIYHDVKKYRLDTNQRNVFAYTVNVNMPFRGWRSLPFGMRTRTCIFIHASVHAVIFFSSNSSAKKATVVYMNMIFTAVFVIIVSSICYFDVKYYKREWRRLNIDRLEEYELMQGGRVPRVNAITLMEDTYRFGWLGIFGLVKLSTKALRTDWSPDDFFVIEGAEWREIRNVDENGRMAFLRACIDDRTTNDSRVYVIPAGQSVSIHSSFQRYQQIPGPQDGYEGSVVPSLEGGLSVTNMPQTDVDVRFNVYPGGQDNDRFSSQLRRNNGGQARPSL